MILRLIALAAFLAPQARAAGTLLVINKGEHSVSLVDPAANREVARIDEKAVTGHEIAASADGRYAYVPIYGDSVVGKAGGDGRTLEVIDLGSRRIIGVVDFGHGVRPHCARYDATSGLLYVTAELDRAVAIIDPKRLRIVGEVPTGQAESHMLVLTRNGRIGYTANVGPGTVSVLDLRGRRTIAIIPVAKHVQRIAITNDDRRVFTSDTGEPRLAVIDTSKRRVTHWIALPGKGYGAAPSPDGRWLLIAIPGKGQVAVVDLLSEKVARAIDVSGSPQEVLVRPDGKIGYVSCSNNRRVAAIDLTTWSISAQIPAGASTDGLAWAGR